MPNKTPVTKSGGKNDKESLDAIRQKLVLTGADIVALGEEAELLVGGKNYNTALISQIEGIQAPYFRAISSKAFHHLLDETKVSGRVVRSVVDKEYGRIDWNDPEINQDPDFLQKFVRQLGRQITRPPRPRPSRDIPNCAPSSITWWTASPLPRKASTSCASVRSWCRPPFCPWICPRM